MPIYPFLVLLCALEMAAVVLSSLPVVANESSARPYPSRRALRARFSRTRSGRINPHGDRSIRGYWRHLGATKFFTPVPLASLIVPAIILGLICMFELGPLCFLVPRLALLRKNAMLELRRRRAILRNELT